MKMIIVLIKELFESLVRNYRIVSNKNYKNYKNYKELKNNGLIIRNDFLTKEKCKEFREKIDSMIENESIKTWTDEKNSDHRIYFANTLDDDFNDFYNNQIIRDVLCAHTGTTRPNGMLLAARIDAKDGNLGSGGGWHRDSPFTHQFKAVCYLSDVSEKNGPFQYIKESHKKFNVLKAYIMGVFKPGQYRFNQNEINNYLNIVDEEIKEFTAEEGAIAFADTKGIHRGKPIIEGSRYVLFCYFWHGNIPVHFERFKQN